MAADRAAWPQQPSTPPRSVDEHRAAILAAVEPLRELEVSLLEAHGCVLAEDVTSPHALPAFDNSAMDGYAVRWEDVVGATDDRPVQLPVVGDVAAGDAGRYKVQPGLSVRIMTGAVVPDGADAVVPVEWTDGGLSRVSITRCPQPGQHIRRAGEDVEAGEAVLSAGTHLGAAQVSLLAAIGRARVRVRPRPRVVIISTGSELVSASSPA